MSRSPTTAMSGHHHSHTADKTASSAKDNSITDQDRGCFFFTPPPEIRVRIYQYALLSDTTEVPATDDGPQHGKDCTKLSCVTHKNWRIRSALLQVCRLIRHEAMPIFFLNSTIHLHVNKHNYGDLLDLIGSISKEQACLIPRLIISWMPTQKLVDVFLATYGALSKARAEELEEQAKAAHERAMDFRRVMHEEAVGHSHEELQDLAFPRLQTQTSRFKEVRRRLKSQLSITLFHEGLAHKAAADVLVRALPPSGIALEKIKLLTLRLPDSQPHLGMLQQQFLTTLEHDLREAFGTAADRVG